MKKTLCLFMSVFIVVSVLEFHQVLAARNAISPLTVKFNAMADSYVNSSYPSRNYGSLGSMSVEGGTLAYIMFDLSSLPTNATIAKAAMKLFCYSGTWMMIGSGYISAHYCKDNSWTEDTITWENKPAYESNATDRETHGMYVGWDVWDVTKDAQTTVMNEDRKLTMVLSRYNIRGSYYSRERGPNNVVLEVEYLIPPAYVIVLNSAQDTGGTRDIGITKVEAEIFSLPSEFLANPRDYSIEYGSELESLLESGWQSDFLDVYIEEYEFVRWETTGGVKVSDKSARNTTLLITGAGGLTAIGKAGKLRLESKHEKGVSSDIGYVIIDDIFASTLPMDLPVVKPGIHTVSYQGGYRFIRWEASGAVSVSDAHSSTTTILVSAGEGTLRAIGAADIMEYGYDDGRTDTSYYRSETAGKMWAVKFTPLFSGKVLKARFYILDQPTTFNVHVMDQNMNDIIRPFPETPVSSGWFDIDLSRFDIQAKAKRDFYIGIEWTTKYKPYLGYDRNEPIDRRSWQWNGTKWDTFPYYSGDMMIRAIVETKMIPSQITCNVQPASIQYKGTTKVSGSISPSDPETSSAPVTIQFSNDKVSWSNVANISCISSNYLYSWTLELPAANYFVRAIWKGSDTYFEAESGPQSLTVMRVQTTLVCKFDAETGMTDQTLSVSGSISPAAHNAEIILMWTLPNGYRFNQTVRTSPDGRFSFARKASEEGIWKVKAYWPGDENHFGSESGVSQFKAESLNLYLIVGIPVVVLVIGLATYFVLRRRKAKPREVPTFAPPPPPP